MSYKPFIKLPTEGILHLAKKVSFHQKYKTIWFKTLYIWYYFLLLAIISAYEMIYMWKIFIWRQCHHISHESESKVAQSCPTLSDPMDCSPPSSSVHEILHTRILEWVTTSFSRGSSWPRDQTSVSCVSCTAGRFFTTEPLGKLLASSSMWHQKCLQALPNVHWRQTL